MNSDGVVITGWLSMGFKVSAPVDRYKCRTKLPLRQFLGLEHFLLKILVKCEWRFSPENPCEMQTYYLEKDKVLTLTCVSRTQSWFPVERELHLLLCGWLIWLFIECLLCVRCCLNKTDINFLLSKTDFLVRGGREKLKYLYVVSDREK